MDFLSWDQDWLYVCVAPFGARVTSMYSAIWPVSEGEVKENVLGGREKVCVCVCLECAYTEYVCVCECECVLWYILRKRRAHVHVVHIICIYVHAMYYVEILVGTVLSGCCGWVAWWCMRGKGGLLRARDPGASSLLRMDVHMFLEDRGWISKVII